MISVAPLKDKVNLYTNWQAETENISNIWADIVCFCAEECKSPLFSEMSISETITAFPGALSPFSIRQANFEPNYEIASQYYANSQFIEAAALLTESIDMNSLSPPSYAKSFRSNVSSCKQAPTRTTISDTMF